MIHITYLENYESINQEIFSCMKDITFKPQHESAGHLIYSDTVLGIDGKKMSNIIIDKNLKLLENAILSSFKEKLAIIQSWLLKTEPGGYCTDHHHGEIYSGVYYVDAKKNQGAMRFTDIQTKETIDIEPRTGNIIFFRQIGPKPLMHRVLKNNTDTSRISLSFDLVLK